MKIVLSLLLILFSLSCISALCNSTQIDINSANSTELDKIITVGPATALKIISARPFSSLDDLIKVNGIGNLTLSKIKTQGLACVFDEEINSKDNESTLEIIDKTTPNIPAPVLSSPQNSSPESFQMQAIKVDTQNIKTNNENGNYAIYGFIGFCILLAVLFILKKREKKNEFR
ncbi:MAG TPA: helix-hairpin-helix domain-containing protein [Patescibacteria group bacterium]|nr:helix-hairpin-helix domain-containing protein [Patescibacteria group bacterium]